MTSEDSGRIEDVLSVFEQAPALLLGVEGPRMILKAWNRACRDMTQPLFGSLGVAVTELEFLRGSQTAQLLHDTYTMGRPFTARDWHLPLPEADGSVADHYFDFTYLPWRWPDGSIRGVMSVATDVTEQVLARRELERASARWEQRFRASSDAMRALQASLLPASVPVLPGVQLAARYLLADADTSAGGDWFSTLTLADGRIGLVVGDVVGHGVAAAATMGQLRAVLEERLLDGAGIVGALEAVERVAARVAEAEAATVCVVLLDPSSGALEYCTAGHPPPLLVDGESWSYLPLTGSGPLRSGQDVQVGHAHLPPDGLLLLYTDGLVERPGRDWARSSVEIGDVVVNALAGRPVRVDDPTHAGERVCRNTVELLTRMTGHTDDITVVAARRIPAPPALDVDVPGEAHGVLQAVLELDRWLEAVDAGDEDQQDLRVALVELFTNSVEHGLRDRSDGHVRLMCELAADGTAQLELSDDGQWREHEHAVEIAGDGRGAGLGLPLVGQLADQVLLQHDQSGTRVQMRRRLSRPASLQGAPSTARSRPALDDRLTAFVPPGEPGTVHVIGPVVGEGAETLRGFLEMESRAGTAALRVDLSAVTHLASSGVRVIQQFRRHMQGHGVDVEVIAPPDSAAGHVLTLVGIPHHAESPRRTG